LNQLYSVSAARDRIFYGSPDLDPERARVLELGWRYEVPGVTADIALFHTRARDYIDRQRVTATPVGYVPPSNPALDQWQYGNGYAPRDSGLPLATGTLGLRSYQVLGQLDGEFDLFIRTASGAERRGADRQLEERQSGYATLNLAMTLDFQDRLSARVLLGN